MREPDRHGVLEAALPRARDQQGRHSRRFRYSGPGFLLPPALVFVSVCMRIATLFGYVRISVVAYFRKLCRKKMYGILKSSPNFFLVGLFGLDEPRFLDLFLRRLKLLKV